MDELKEFRNIVAVDQYTPQIHWRQDKLCNNLQFSEIRRCQQGEFQPCASQCNQGVESLIISKQKSLQQLRDLVQDSFYLSPISSQYFLNTKEAHVQLISSELNQAYQSIDQQADELDDELAELQLLNNQPDRELLMQFKRTQQLLSSLTNDNRMQQLSLSMAKSQIRQFQRSRQDAPLTVTCATLCIGGNWRYCKIQLNKAVLDAFTAGDNIYTRIDIREFEFIPNATDEAKQCEFYESDDEYCAFRGHGKSIIIGMCESDYQAFNGAIMAQLRAQ